MKMLFMPLIACAAALMLAALNSGCATHLVEGTAPARERPLAHAGRAAIPPVIDGRLDDDCWQSASLLSGFITQDGFWSREQTTARLTYDDGYLYIAMVCYDRHPQRLRAVKRQHDDVTTCQDDCVEIFIDADNDKDTYNHLMINPLGCIYEAACGQARSLRDAQWNPECAAAVVTNSGDWTVEIRIDWASLGLQSPPAGTLCGINLNRERRTSPDDEASSWAMCREFNAPEEFGQVLLGAPEAVSYSIRALDSQKNDCRAELLVRNGTDVPKEVRMTMAQAGSTNAFSRIVTLAAQAEAMLEGSLAIDRRRPPLLVLTLASPSDGAVYRRREALLREFEFVPPVALMVDRYYYPPDVDAIRGLVSIDGNGASQILSVKLIHGEDEQTIALPGTNDHAQTAGKYPFVIAADSLAPGRYVVTATLADQASGETFADQKVFFKREIPTPSAPPSTEKMVISRKGVVMLDGKPFCPFFGSGTRISSPLATNCYNVRYAGFGLVDRPLERISLPCGSLTKTNNQWRNVLPEESKIQDRIRAQVARQKSNPQLLEWFLCYEAQIPMYRSGDDRTPLNNPAELKKISALVKSLDPGHPTAIQIDRLDLLTAYRDAADIIEIACPSSYARKLIPGLPSDVDKVKSRIGSGRPFFLWIGAAIPDEKYRTAETIRCASYLALMHGAKGLVYHLGHGGVSPDSTRHWSVYRGLLQEVNEIYPIVIAADPGMRPRATPDASRLDICVRQYNGRIYLVACNLAQEPISAVFDLSSQKFTTAQVLFENRKLPIEDGKLKDEFTAYEPHVYELSATKSPAGP